MGTYLAKRCPDCQKLAHRCKCGTMNPRKAKGRTGPNAAQIAALTRLIGTQLDEIPGNKPEKNLGGRQNAWKAGRQEVYGYFVKGLCDVFGIQCPIGAENHRVTQPVPASAESGDEAEAGAPAGKG